MGMDSNMGTRSSMDMMSTMGYSICYNSRANVRILAMKKKKLINRPVSLKPGKKSFWLRTKAISCELINKQNNI